MATAPGQLILHVGQDVGINVQGDSEAGVAQVFADRLAGIPATNWLTSDDGGEVLSYLVRDER